MGGAIPRNATLHFLVELIDVNEAPRVPLRHQTELSLHRGKGAVEIENFFPHEITFSLPPCLCRRCISSENLLSGSNRRKDMT